MDKLKKKHLIILGSFLLLVGMLFVVFRIHEQHQEEELRMEREAELEIIYTYLRLHYAFARNDHPDTIDEGIRRERMYEFNGVYEPIERINDHGVNAIVYLLLRFYYHRAGVYLSYEVVEDYFSEEFEPDGSLRLYNNGNHPEIEAFVTWMWEGLRAGGDGEFDEYVRRIGGMESQYWREHRDQGFQDQGPLHELTPQMLDALARAEADPDYVLDLTSLQEQGY